MTDLIKLNWKENSFPGESICDTIIKIIAIIVEQWTVKINNVRKSTGRIKYPKKFISRCKQYLH